MSTSPAPRTALRLRAALAFALAALGCREAPGDAAPADSTAKNAVRALAARSSRLEPSRGDRCLPGMAGECSTGEICEIHRGSFRCALVFADATSLWKSSERASGRIVIVKRLTLEAFPGAVCTLVGCRNADGTFDNCCNRCKTSARPRGTEIRSIQGADPSLECVFRACETPTCFDPKTTYELIGKVEARDAMDIVEAELRRTSP